MHRVYIACAALPILCAACSSTDNGNDLDGGVDVQAGDASGDARRIPDDAADSQSDTSSDAHTRRDAFAEAETDGSSQDSSDDISPEATTDGSRDSSNDVTADAQRLIDATTEGSTDAPADAADSGDATDGSPTCSALCPTGEKMCSNSCVAIDDPQYGCSASECSPCTVVPSNPSITYGTLGCSGSACVITECPPGLADCDGLTSNGCESDLGSAQTCGSCTSPCTANQVCDNGTCGPSCAFPKTNCGGACHNLASDPVSCGSCGAVCPGEDGTPSCTNGACGITCNMGWSSCGSTTDGCSSNIEEGSLSSLSTYGGHGFYDTCGASCEACTPPTYGAVTTCTNGQCASSCAPGFTQCGTACVDERSDTTHCGSCSACTGTDVCVAGQCTAPSALQVVTGLMTPSSLAVDASNIYYVDSGSNTVWQANKVTFASIQLATNQAKPLSVAIDATTVYWTSNLGGAILMTPIGGGAVTVLYAANQPTAIAVDANYIYWSDDGSRQIFKAPKAPDAGAPVALASQTTPELKEDDANLYGWTAAVGVFVISKSAGTETPYVNQLHPLDGMGISSSLVFWGSTFNGFTYQLFFTGKIAGGAVNGTLVSTMPLDITTDDCSVYWTDGSSSVWTLPLSAVDQVTPRSLTAAATQSNHIVVDDSYIYWTDQTWIGRVPK